MAHKIYGQNVTIIKGESIDPLAGTWVFNNTLQKVLNEAKIFIINFTSNNASFDNVGIIVDEKPWRVSYSNNASVPTVVDAYSSDSGWTNEAYKTITITSKLSEVTNGDTLLAWLQANATKQ